MLAARVDEVRRVLARGPGAPDVPLRVAASLVQLGLVARLMAPLLGAGPLAGTGSCRDDGTFVRRSCCLRYRLPGAGTCGDCVLAARG